MPDQTINAAHAVRRRILIILAITFIAEIALFITARLGPALAHLVLPVYFIVAAAGALSVWHAATRHGRDRRKADRRHAPR